MDLLVQAAVCMVLESESEAKRRNATSYSKFIGWGQGSDGHNVAISHPEGRGLQGAMENALKDAKLSPTDIDYVNAHAPSTSIGDASEMKALKATFPLPQKNESFQYQTTNWARIISFKYNGSCLLLYRT